MPKLSVRFVFFFLFLTRTARIIDQLNKREQYVCMNLVLKLWIHLISAILDFLKTFV